MIAQKSKRIHFCFYEPEQKIGNPWLRKYINLVFRGKSFGVIIVEGIVKRKGGEA
jgi:hypothetical protein